MVFSIIVPIYNVESYLQECVDSILKQSFTNYEIILVDDGSTDNSPQICDKLAEKYDFIRVIHKKNGGAADSRNVGVKEARGEYIVFIDSDDFILENSFLDDVNKNISEDVQMVIYKYCKYFDDSKRLAECNFSYKNVSNVDTYSDQISALIKNDAFYGMAWIRTVKRSVLIDNDINFEVGLTGEDMDWNYKLMLIVSNIRFLDKPYIAYRQRSGSVTTSCKIKNLSDFVLIVEKWSEELQKITEKKLRNAFLGSLAKYYSNLLIMYSRLDDPVKKEYAKRIKCLDWLLSYSMSRRPQMISKIYRIVGFNMTIVALKIMDRIKRYGSK